MGRGISLRSGMIKGAALALAGITAACAHVGQDQFDAELATLRAEMEQNAAASNRGTEAQMAQLEARLDGIARGLSGLEREFNVTVQRLETAVRFDMPVYFDFDKANLRPEDLPVLERFAGVVGQYYPDALLTVEGFTDPSGSATYNLALGQRRAEAVQRYLIESADFSPDHVRAVSYGEDSARLVAPGQGGQQAGWENRRVVLVIEHVGYESDKPMVVGGGQ